MATPMPAATPATTRASRSAASEAAHALFVNSDLESARARSAAALLRNPADVEALFVEMEAAALEADTAAELEAALRLCESASARADNDARVTIAAMRMVELA